MKRLLASVMGVMTFAGFAAVADAQSACPPEVAKAREMLTAKASFGKSQDVQPPRALAGGRGRRFVPDAGRGQDVQAPPGQDVQAPRGQDVQPPRALAGGRGRRFVEDAGRGQDAQAPRAIAGATPSGDISRASTLVKEAEAACNSGDMTAARAKAEAAIAILE